MKETKCDCSREELIGRVYMGTSEDYDGVSEWYCMKCKKRFGRWTGNELKDGELEPRFGKEKSAA